MTQKKLNHLEAARGLAALVVVITHYFSAFYPYSVFGNRLNYIQFSSWESILWYPPFNIFLSAHFSVCFFFVLSGYVLSFKHIGDGNRVKSLLVGSILKRPIRLGGLVLSTQLIAAVLWRGGLFFNYEVSEITKSVPWFREFWVSSFSVNEFIADLFLSPFSSGYKYNPVLWTISVELYGSILIFLFIIFFGSYRYRIIIYSILIISFAQSYYQSFWIGVILADLFKNTKITDLLKNKFLSFSLLVLGVFLSSYPSYRSVENDLVYDWLPKIHFLGGGYSTLGAIVLFVAMNSPFIRPYLEFSWLVFLGKLSYSNYAIHQLVLGSISSYLFLQLYYRIGHFHSFIVVLSLSLIIILLLSYVMTKWIDNQAKSASKIVGNFTANIYDKLLGVKP